MNSMWNGAEVEIYLHRVKGCQGLRFAFIIYKAKCLYDVVGDTFAFSWLNEPEFYLGFGIWSRVVALPRQANQVDNPAAFDEKFGWI